MSLPRLLPDRFPGPLAPRQRAFTLIELLVVIGLIVGLAAFLLGGFGGGTKVVAVQIAQATVANAVTLARTRAVSSGKNVRLLVHRSPASPFALQRYRRLIFLVEENGAAWSPVTSFVLPDGVFVLPYKNTAPAGMYPVAADWRTADGTDVLGSSSLSNTPPMSQSFDGGTPEDWDYIGFTPRGTVDGAGSLIVAVGRTRPPDANSAASPIEMTDPKNVRGVTLSSYGVPRLLSDRTGF